MDRTFVGDLQQLGALGVGEIVAVDGDHTFEPVDHPRPARPWFVVGTLGAVARMHLSVGDLHRDPIERQPLAIRIHPQRHRRARTERSAEQVVRRGAGIESTDRLGLVGEQAVPSDHDMIEERPLGGLGDHDRRRCARRVERPALVDDIAVGECPDHAGRERRIASIGQQMVGPVE